LDWEFLPAFAGGLVPGVDLVPFWWRAVANVYRKWEREAVSEEIGDNSQVIEDEYKSS